jgi:hypothetical protein
MLVDVPAGASPAGGLNFKTTGFNRSPTPPLSNLNVFCKPPATSPRCGLELLQVGLACGKTAAAPSSFPKVTTLEARFEGEKLAAFDVAGVISAISSKHASEPRWNTMQTEKRRKHGGNFAALFLHYAF